MAQLSHFFFNGPLVDNSIVVLDDDTSKHVWQILRMLEGDRLALTDGKGHVAEGTLLAVERKGTKVQLEKVQFLEHTGQKLHLCIGFTKNNTRNEWMLEKATELGVTEIVPVAAARSEKAHFRRDRWQKILMGAILQSMQHYLPTLSDITPLGQVMKKFANTPQKFIAHCIPDKTKKPLAEILKPGKEAVILIGPEGDFTQEEVNLAIQNGFKPVSLSRQRLRTETAAISACAFFNVLNDGK